MQCELREAVYNGNWAAVDALRARGVEFTQNMFPRDEADIPAFLARGWVPSADPFESHKHGIKAVKIKWLVEQGFGCGGWIDMHFEMGGCYEVEEFIKAGALLIRAGRECPELRVDPDDNVRSSETLVKRGVHDEYQYALHRRVAAAHARLAAAIRASDWDAAAEVRESNWAYVTPEMAAGVTCPAARARLGLPPP